MTSSIADQLEKRIRDNRLLDFSVDWSDEIVYPYYDGLALPNVTQSIAQILGAPFSNPQPLHHDVWQGAMPHAKRVMLFLLDGLGYKHLRKLIETDSELYDAVMELNGGRDFIPLTSIAPSTTAVALPTLWTGTPPAQTGMTGTLMFLREISTLSNMLSFAPVNGRHHGDALDSWGMPIESIVQSKGFAQHLGAHNIDTHVVTEYAWVNVGLSRILHRGVSNTITQIGKVDFFGQIKQVLKDTRGQSGYISVYWSGVDSLAHRYGAHHDYTNEEVKRVILGLRDLVRSDELADGETLFVLLADHGHYDSLEPIHVGDDPVLHDAMQMSIAGDERHGYMYVRHGMLETVKDHIISAYGDRLVAIESQVAIEAGCFGDAPSDVLKHRIGDLILLPRLGYILSDPVLGSLHMISRHAGLSDWEMLVPFIWQLS